MIAEYLIVFVIAIFILKLVIPWIIFFHQILKIPDSEMSLLKDFRWKLNRKYRLTMLYDNIKASKHEISKCLIGFHTVIIVKSPELAKIVMDRCLTKSTLSDYVGYKRGIVLGSGDEWKVQREIVSRFLTSLSVQKLIPVFDERSDVLMERLERVKEEFNVFNHIAALSLETVLSIMGLNIDLQLQNEEVRDVAIINLEKFSNIVHLRICVFYLHPLWIYKRTRLFLREVDARSKWTGNFASEIIKNAKVNEQGKPMNMIEALIASNLDEAMITETIISMNFAAQDTSAITVSTTLLMLAMHPIVQQKVLNEIAELVIRNKNRNINKVVSSLNYLEMVINEVLRLFAPGPLNLRKSSNNLVLNGLKIPNGVTLLIPIHNFHRSEKVWGDDAKIFRPERFEHLSEIQRSAFMPFTRGPRICVGQHYAMLFIKIVLVKIIRSYRIETSMKFSDIELQAAITTTIIQGYKIQLKDRIN